MRTARRASAGLLTLIASISGCTAIAGLSGDYEQGDPFASVGIDGGALPSATTSPTATSTTPPPPDTKDAGADAAEGGAAGPPSCSGLGKLCGPATSDDCCHSAKVPGGTFNRLNRASSPATLSPFGLDIYEVTVGRFRAFVAAGMGTKATAPAVGTGGHPKVATSGWKAEYTDSLPASTAALEGQLGCKGGTYTQAAGANETRPIACVSWFLAFAFCAWDGGRLPTESELSFAASGGDEQRVYPWSNPPTSDTIDATYATYAQSETKAVGMLSPKGDGRWGHTDLAGNVWEWSLDGYVDPLVMPCVDCSPAMDGAGLRARRGGGFGDTLGELTNYYRWGQGPTGLQPNVGMRCARDL